MATKIGLGVPIPKLAPATAFWAAPFTIFYLVLQNRIVYHRLNTKTYLGDNSQSKSGFSSDPLYLASRCQANFAENVPLALTIALLAEVNGGNRNIINYGLGTLFAVRIGHALGLGAPGAMGIGRIVGYYGTQVVMTFFTGYLGYLVKDYWQI
ncbi:membrane-associated, eicosanoid/glutathione metabolism protein [Dendryphion nanum]|uniref:Membrane-associated, eicosanoid/glutathione metabolism protein n=1 Tax=Dendryphion nanum TaxID=256645 RepID=A0A9P9EIH8_9PLEO|nr:membrane-associated, eicosanoid/glutathione metabolism protein [Dendryphion nanum]